MQLRTPSQQGRAFARPGARVGHPSRPTSLQCHQHRHSRCAVCRAGTTPLETEVLLDAFWEARGVFDPSQRKVLVDAAAVRPDGAVATLSSGEPLPGLSSAWTIDQSSSEVVEVSRRLVRLRQLLGDRGDVDVVRMVVREPRLLAADYGQVARRLLEMKVAAAGTGIDVVKVLERQPALVLSDSWTIDLNALAALQQQEGHTGARNVPSSSDGGGSGSASAVSQAAVPRGRRAQQQQQKQAPSKGDLGSVVAAMATVGATEENNGREAIDSSGSSSSGSTAGTAGTAQHGDEAAPGEGPASRQVAVREMVQAWEFGLASDGAPEWEARWQQLVAYRAAHGDASVGFRDGDDVELARWATKQRADARRGELSEARRQKLEALGFEFQEEEAEWVRYYAQLSAFREQHGHASPMPLVTGDDIYLINWCAIQRIARRSRVLLQSRVDRLDALGFDWTGADPLS